MDNELLYIHKMLDGYSHRIEVTLSVRLLLLLSSKYSTKELSTWDIQTHEPNASGSRMIIVCVRFTFLGSLYETIYELAENSGNLSYIRGIAFERCSFENNVISSFTNFNTLEAQTALWEIYSDLYKWFNDLPEYKPVQLTLIESIWEIICNKYKVNDNKSFEIDEERFAINFDYNSKYLIFIFKDSGKKYCLQLAISTDAETIKRNVDILEFEKFDTDNSCRYEQDNESGQIAHEVQKLGIEFFKNIYFN